MNRRFILLLSLVFIVLFVSLFFAFSKKKTEKQIPSLFVSPSFSSLRENLNAKTLLSFWGAPEEVRTLSEYSLGIYSVQSSINRKNEAVYNTDSVVFIKEVITSESTLSLEQITSAFGSSPVVLYGPMQDVGILLYAYPEKGFAYVANKENATAILFEAWYFTPNSLQSILTQYPFNEYSTSPNTSRLGY